MSGVFPKELLVPSRTIFRPGAVRDIAKETLVFGPRGLIVHGRSLQANGEKEKILASFSPGASVETFCRLAGEPTLEETTAVIQAARAARADWIAGIGGGSVLDLAKAAAGLFHASQSPVYYQEGESLEAPGIPFIAVPTTAGTGSEATPNSVLINREKKTKLSIRDRRFMARTVILDPDLPKGMPHDAMAYSAMDALVQAYESFTSRNATWFSESLALKAIELVNGNILDACLNGRKENLAPLLLGSYLGGIALASSRLGVIHGVAHPLGVLYDLPHGWICAVCFLSSLQINREAMGDKYDRMGDVIGMDLQERVKQLLSELKISSPFRGKVLIEKQKIIDETLASGSTAANPKPVTAADVELILKEIF